MIDIKDLIKSRYAQDSDLKKSFDMPDSISKRILRKSCRKFKKSKISKEILISLIASAQSAPSKSNLQQYSILLIKNKEMKNQLSKLLCKTAWALEAPLFFLFLADIRRNKIITEHKGYEYKNNRWQEIDSGNTLRILISKKMHDIYIKKPSALISTITQLENNDQKSDTLKVKATKIGDICVFLKTTSWKANIMKKLITIFKINYARLNIKTGIRLSSGGNHYKATKILFLMML